MIRYQWKNFPFNHTGFSDGAMKIRLTKIKSIYKSNRRLFNFGSGGLDKRETLNSYTNTVKIGFFLHTYSHKHSVTIKSNWNLGLQPAWWFTLVMPSLGRKIMSFRSAPLWDPLSKIPGEKENVLIKNEKIKSDYSKHL
jgi:hypothetical protein